MARLDLKGLGIALITPFKQDGSVDFEALGRLLDYQLRNGADYLVVKPSRVISYEYRPFKFS